MSHYFMNDLTLESKPHEISFTINNHNYSFLSDAGVFSKNRLDNGTFYLLKAVSELKLGKTLLDLGCGIGILGLVIASENEGVEEVVLSDINERALNLAASNKERIKINKKIEIINSDVYEKLENRRFMTIVSNPPIRAGKKVTYRIYDEASDHLENGGSLIIVVRKQQGSPSVIRHLQGLFTRVEILLSKKGYQVIRAWKEGTEG